MTRQVVLPAWLAKSSCLLMFISLLLALVWLIGWIVKQIWGLF